MSEVVGSIDYVGRRFVRGWALDRLHPERPVRVDVECEGRRLARLTPSLSRPDLGRDPGSEPGADRVGVAPEARKSKAVERSTAAPRCGFVFRISGELLDGRRRWLHFTFADQGGELEGSPVRLRELEEDRAAPFALHDPTGERVLVLAPHPDDEALGCGGTIALHRRAGDRVKVVFLTDGGRGDWSGARRRETADRREAEAGAALDRLGVAESELWRLPDRGLDLSVDAPPRLRELLRNHRPTLVYCTSPLDPHPDHRAACRLLYDALQELGTDGAPTVAFYEISRPLNVNRLVDITSTVDCKRQAISCYRSQLVRLPYLEAALGLNRYRSLAVGGDGSAPGGETCSHAEGFLTIDGESFRSRPLHAVALGELGPARPRRLEKLPLVSIIVRTRNRPALLREALSSLVCQTYSNLEVILVEDGDDDLSRLVAEFSKLIPLTHLEAPERLGRARAANRGIAAAAGELLGFLDDDDLLYPEHVEKLAGFLATTGEHVAYSDCEWARYRAEQGTFTLVEKTSSPYDMDYDPRRLRVQNFLPIHCLLLSREVVERVGPLDESFAVYEDWDFWIRVSEEFHFHYLPGATAEYRRLTAHPYDHLRWHLRINEKHGFPQGRLQKTWMGLVWSGRQVSALRTENGRLRREVERLSRALEQAGSDRGPAAPERPRIFWLLRAWWSVFRQRWR